MISCLTQKQKSNVIGQKSWDYNAKTVKKYVFYLPLVDRYASIISMVKNTLAHLVNREVVDRLAFP